MAEIDRIMAVDNANAEAALIELDRNRSTLSVNDAGSSSCYCVATACNVAKNNDPILDSGASTTFVTSDEYLTNARKYKTPVAAANGHISFKQSVGKYKLADSANLKYVAALSAPDFAQNLVSVGQLDLEHNFLFTKTGCYLLDTSAAPTRANIFGVRGKDSLYRMKHVQGKKRK